MQKHWFIIYTKPGMEKKVAAHLAKRNIESFVPLNSKTITAFKKSKIFQEPLFQSYVFVRIDDDQKAKIKLLEGVVNFVFWKGKTAIIQNEEIELMKEFVAHHREIKIEKLQINSWNIDKSIVGSEYSMSGNLLTIRNTSARVDLPSIGFSLVARVSDPNALNIQGFVRKKGLLQES